MTTQSCNNQTKKERRDTLVASRSSIINNYSMQFSILSIIAAMTGAVFGLPQGCLDDDYARSNISCSVPSMASTAQETITTISTLPPGVTPPHQGVPESILPQSWVKWTRPTPPLPSASSALLETSMPGVMSIPLHQGFPARTLRTTIKITHKITGPKGKWTWTTKPPAATVPSDETRTTSSDTSRPSLMRIMNVDRDGSSTWKTLTGTWRTTTIYPPTATVPSVRGIQARSLETSIPTVMSISYHQVWPEQLDTLRTTTRPAPTDTAHPLIATVPSVRHTQAKPSSWKQGGPSASTSWLDRKSCIPYVATEPVR
ncbi:hypothetical protein D6D24_04038 [Aureobasidium pullulans]|uniref:Uncharacterized protein n=1 Tax=Aureobasidium pullulans TaxID=5580 RepID=A0A4V4IBX7_AURPU|nr:hypothetical protein D6D24_04038 [Aureobasidium pullulans]